MRVGFNICDVCEHVNQGPPVGLMAPMGTRNTSLQLEVCGECWEGIMNRIDSLSKLRHLLKLPAELFTDAGVWRITFDGSSHDPQVDDAWRYAAGSKAQAGADPADNADAELDRALYEAYDEHETSAGRRPEPDHDGPF